MRRGVQPALSPAPPGLLHPGPHLDPPHRIFYGRRRGRHLLVHHSPEFLLMHVQDLGLQLLGDEGIQESEEVDSTSHHPTEPGSKTGAAGP